jgi:hypothetical protein
MTKETVFNVISRADHGVLLSELDERLNEVVQAVLDTGVKGAITIQIDVGKAKGNNAMMEITTSFKAKTPEPVRVPDLYFADDDGKLSRKDPRQPDLLDNNVQPLRS